ncbi:hypothetical protein QO009_001305, partial [Brevibacillus aydinogluensis]|nr:hypothetical protein [Brevibacillus aydinogluensis]
SGKGSADTSASQIDHPVKRTNSPINQPTSKHDHAGEDSKTQPIPHGMDRVFCAGRGENPSSANRGMDSPKAPALSMDAVETSSYEVPRTSFAWIFSQQSTGNRKHPKGGVADNKIPAHAQSPWYCLLATTRADEFDTAIFHTSSSLVNRRIPVGTYGGVRGRGLTTPSYSIANNLRQGCYCVLNTGAILSMRLVQMPPV